MPQQQTALLFDAEEGTTSILAITTTPPAAVMPRPFDGTSVAAPVLAGLGVTLLLTGLFLLGNRNRWGFLTIGATHGLLAGAGWWLGHVLPTAVGLGVLLLSLRGFVRWRPAPAP
jgi:hypothetical protein